MLVNSGQHLSHGGHRLLRPYREFAIDLNLHPLM